MSTFQIKHDSYHGRESIGTAQLQTAIKTYQMEIKH